MKVYIDSILLLNFLFDALILLTVSIILKRNIKLRRIVLGSFLASLSVLTLFISIPSFILFIFKFILMIIIIISTFGFKNIKYTFNNTLYFFIINIIYGGFLYYLNIEFNYKNLGLIFYNKKINTNYMFLIIISPIILYIYMKSSLKLKYEYSLKKKVDVYLKNGKVIKLNGYLDTANRLIDPYGKRMVFITNSKELFKNIKNSNTLLVPYETIDSSGMLRCLIPKKTYIEGIGTKDNIVIGYIEKDFHIDGVNCILNGGLEC